MKNSFIQMFLSAAPMLLLGHTLGLSIICLPQATLQTQAVYVFIYLFFIYLASAKNPVGTDKSETFAEPLGASVLIPHKTCCCNFYHKNCKNLWVCGEYRTSENHFSAEMMSLTYTAKCSLFIINKHSGLWGAV